jgi:hypothetical protein
VTLWTEPLLRRDQSISEFIKLIALVPYSAHGELPRLGRGGETVTKPMEKARLPCMRQDSADSMNIEGSGYRKKERQSMGGGS